jgi:hypothetical protein
MENTVIKKRLNTYKSDGGRLSKVDDEVVLDVLRAWENWQGSTADLYRELGLSKMQLVIMIKKGKKLVKKGAGSGGSFKEISISAPSGGSPAAGYAIEVSLEDGRLVRFREVSRLIEFLKLTGKDADV